MIGNAQDEAQVHTAASAMGFRAGPLSPPVPAPSTGLPDQGSIAMPRAVLTHTSASAPSASAARPISETSATFGDSFTQSGSAVTARQAR